jgi:hypothetical protein
MDLLALHIHPLDDNEEADEIIALLTQAGLSSDWTIEKPTEATNALFVPVEIQSGALADWEIRQQKLEKALVLLRALQPATIAAIQECGLDVAMRIHTEEFYLPLPVAFVRECARLGLEICIFNTRSFQAK